jgi:hypothetical protein
LLASLEASLLQLRERWPQGWPGLSLVFDRCWQRLGADPRKPSQRVQALIRCAHDVAARIERDGRARQRQGAEPQYHNRLHIADTLVCMTHLLLAQRQVQAPAKVAPISECLALLVMLGHDYLHNGQVNRFPAELETIAVTQLQPILQRHGVAPQDQAMVTHCILKTDPSGVKQSHALIAGRAFRLADRDCLAVLVEEADILASTLMVTSEGLTLSLSKEWESSNPAMAQGLLKPASRIYFLENAALFSSPAACLLGIPVLKQAEVDAVRRALAAPAQA